MKRLLYFGCIGGPGHYLFDTDGHRFSNTNFIADEIGVNRNLLNFMDGVFTPKSFSKQGFYNDCIVPPVRIVAWCDFSVDTRPGSNSNLIGIGYKLAEEMIDDAYKLFPSVMNRQERPVPYYPANN